MAISKEKKRQMVADYVQSLSGSQAIILTDYRGLSTAQLTELRRRLRADGGRFQVVKNTLFKRALDQVGIPIPEDQIRDTVAVGYCLDEVPPVAKTLTDFAKETDVLVIKGALISGTFVDAERVKELASLPPREILLGQVVGAIQGPMSSLVSTITAPMRELVQVLKARSEQEAGQAAA